MSGTLSGLPRVEQSRLAALAAAPVARRAWEVAPEPMIPPGVATMQAPSRAFPLDPVASRANPVAAFMQDRGFPMTQMMADRLMQRGVDAATNWAGTTPLVRTPAARAARAAEQGYTIDAYKAMYPETGYERRRRNGEWIEEGTRVPVTEFNSPGNPYAGFFSDNPEVANKFAQAFGAESAIYPARLRFSNPLVIDAGGRPAGAFQFDVLARQHGAESDMARFRSAFAAESPYDGVILRNTADEGTVYVPRTPQQARSRFANFDPARAGSGDMLASWAAGLGLGAMSYGGQQSE